MSLLDESDSEHNSGIDSDPEWHITHVMDDSDTEGELSDVEIERQQEELYCQEQAQILGAERFSDPDWVPHISQKKQKVANYGEEGNTGV